MRVDEDMRSNEEMVKQVERLGAIHVDVYHKRRVKEERWNCCPSAAEEVGILSEKALKGQAISHSVG